LLDLIKSKRDINDDLDDCVIELEAEISIFKFLVFVMLNKIHLLC